MYFVGIKKGMEEEVYERKRERIFSQRVKRMISWFSSLSMFHKIPFPSKDFPFFDTSLFNSWWHENIKKCICAKKDGTRIPISSSSCDVVVETSSWNISQTWKNLRENENERSNFRAVPFISPLTFFHCSRKFRTQTFFILSPFLSFRCSSFNHEKGED